MSLKRTALYDMHVKLGAKLVPFGGFELPVWYSSLKDEHAAVRQNAGMFDISHMGVLYLTGKDAALTLQLLSCNDVKLTQTKMVYTFFLNNEGGILDDVMMGKWLDGYVVVVNAANKAKILHWINQHIQGDTVVEDWNTTHAFIAIQGPEAVSKVAPILGIRPETILRFGLFSFQTDMVTGMGMRTGYTGEDGVELVVSNSQASALFQACLDAGIQPCGLGARDTLRLEAGLPLYGQELSEAVTPLSTRYHWAVKWNCAFIGKEALLQKKNQYQDFVTVGIEMKSRVIARSHYPITEGGEVTSGTLSPSLDKPIAMAFVPLQYAAIGSILHVEIRGERHAAIVVAIPFK